MILLLMVAAVTIADDPILVLGPALANGMHVSASWSGWFIGHLLTKRTDDNKAGVTHNRLRRDGGPHPDHVPQWSRAG